MKGLVVCPQPRAADVGASILSQGGNAFDAAIATAFRVASQRPLHVDAVAALLTAPSEALDMAPRPGCGTQSWTLYLEHSREHSLGASLVVSLASCLESSWKIDSWCRCSPS